MYVGRGGRGAEPEGWGNPWRLGRGVTRATALKNFDQYARSSPELLARLPELLGKTLRCHCGPEEQCHGDLLIALCAELLGAVPRAAAAAAIARQPAARPERDRPAWGKRFGAPPFLRTVRPGSGRREQ